MAETSRPWSGTSPGDAGGYSSEQWQVMYQTMVGLGGDQADSGILRGSAFNTIYEPLWVYPDAGQAVNINVGSALVQGIFYRNSSVLSKAVAANNSGFARKDLVVLRADYAAQTVRVVVITGTPAASPAIPSMTRSAGVTWDIPLALLDVANGFSTLTAAVIFNYPVIANASDLMMHDNVINGAGGELLHGDVVVWGTGRGVDDTTTLGNANVAGVWHGRTADGAAGRVIYEGLAFVRVAGTTAQGDYLVTSTTAKAATVATPRNISKAFARVLVGNTGAGYAFCQLFAAGTRTHGGIGAQVTYNTANIVPNVITTLSAVSLLYDTGGMYDAGQDTRLTAQVAGQYLIGGAIDMTTDDTAEVTIRLNGSTNIMETDWDGETSADLHPRHVQRVYTLAAGDYVEMRAGHSDPGNQTATGYMYMNFLGS